MYMSMKVTSLSHRALITSNLEFYVCMCVYEHVYKCMSVYVHEYACKSPLSLTEHWSRRIWHSMHVCICVSMCQSAIVYMHMSTRASHLSHLEHWSRRIWYALRFTCIWFVHVCACIHTIPHARTFVKPSYTQTDLALRTHAHTYTYRCNQFHMHVPLRSLHTLRLILLYVHMHIHTCIDAINATCAYLCEAFMASVLSFACSALRDSPIFFSVVWIKIWMSSA